VSFTLLLNTATHDLSIVNGRFALISGVDEINQRINVTLRHLQGEYFLDIQDGTPWYTDLLGSKSAIAEVNLVLRSRVLSVPGVLRINSFEADFDNTTRAYSITMSVQTSDGVIEVDLTIPL